MGRGKRVTSSRSPRVLAVASPESWAIPAAQPKSPARNDVNRLSKQMFELSLAEPRHYQASAQSDLADERFCEFFAGKLIEAHVINHYRVEGRAFETLLARAARSAGLKAQLADSLTSAGHDVIINGARFQLKTEAAKKINPAYITISKLMESAGTKDVASRSDAARFARQSVAAHLTRYDRLVILRAFDQPDAAGRRGVRYELTEIPKTLFAGLERLTARDFKEPRASGHTSAELRVPGEMEPAMTLVLDGSDNKITLRRVRRDLCHVHAVFWVPYGEEIFSEADAAALALEG
jgi:hypothetical protein